MMIDDTIVNQKELISRAKLLSFLEENGENDRTLSKIRDENVAKFGKELIWRYPLPDDKHTGTFIAAVKEGFISLPYSEIGVEGWEYLNLEDALMLDSETIIAAIDDWSSFSENLLRVLREIKGIIN